MVRDLLLRETLGGDGADASATGVWHRVVAAPTVAAFSFPRSSTVVVAATDDGRGVCVCAKGDVCCVAGHREADEEEEEDGDDCVVCTWAADEGRCGAGHR